MKTAMRAILLMVLLAAGPSAVLTGCTQTKIEEKVPPVVGTQKVEMLVPDSTDEYSAVVAPSVQMDVSFKAGGYVDSILKVRGLDGQLRNVQEGDFVRKGTTLARVRANEYQTRVRLQAAAVDEVRLSDERSRAAIAEARISLEQSRTEFERAARLYNTASLTKPEYEAASSRLAMAEAREREAVAQIAVNRATAARAGAGLSEAQLSLQDCTLRAPMDGIVIKRTIEEGSLVASGTAAFTIADAHSVKVSFAVPDVKLRDLTIGQRLAVATEVFPGTVFHGRVTEIAPSADSRTRAFNVEVTVPNTGHKLRPGMVTTLTTGGGSPGTAQAAVPLTAVVRSSANPDGYAVFVIDETGGRAVASERPVKLGEAFGQKITVVEGIKTGDAVVTNGSARVVSGQEVRVLDQVNPVGTAARDGEKPQ